MSPAGELDRVAEHVEGDGHPDGHGEGDPDPAGHNEAHAGGDQAPIAGTMTVVGIGVHERGAAVGAFDVTNLIGAMRSRRGGPRLLWAILRRCGGLGG